MSEQMGWRSMLENLQAEAPHWGKILPQLPRLIHENLLQHGSSQLTEKLENLGNEQKRRNRLLFWATSALVVLALLQLASFMLLMGLG